MPFQVEVGLKGSCMSSGRQKRSSCNYGDYRYPRALLGFNLILLFHCSWCWPWLPKVTPGLHWMLCWQFTEVATMVNNLAYTYGPTPVAVHVSFHSSLDILTHLWLFCSFNYILQIFIFPTLPIIPIINSSHNTVVLLSWLNLLKATTEVYFQTERLKNTTFPTQNCLLLEIVLRLFFFPPGLCDSEHKCRVVILICLTRRNLSE